MTEQKKTHPTAATEERVEAGAGLDRATTSTIEHTTPPASRQMGIAGLLSHGADHGVTLQHLKLMTGLPDREIRKQIEHERRGGALIISDNRHGYYLTDDPAEAQRFARSMRHRAGQIIKTARAVEEAAGLD